MIRRLLFGVLLALLCAAQTSTNVPVTIQPAITFTPAAPSFSANLGNSSTQTVTVTNGGPVNETMTVSLVGTDPGDYSVVSNTCPGTLSAGTSCTIGVTFTPTATGSRPAALEVTLTGNRFTYQVALSGNGGGGSILPAPTTAQGNYGTGCSGGSCLLMDDHWITSSLDTSKWWAGLYFYGFGMISPFWNPDGNCGPGPDVAWSTSAPLSSWHLGVGCTLGAANGSYEYGLFYDYPYSPGSTNAPSLATPALTTASDASLQYTWQQNSFYSANSGFNPQIISADLTSKIAIPSTGGLFQYRFKLDNGLLYGSWGAVQCSADNSQGFNYNFLIELGFTEGGANPLYNAKTSLNNGAPSADIPVSRSDLTNWHVLAIEYEGDTTRNVNWYFDGVPVKTFQQSVTGYNYYCEIGLDVMSPLGSGFHTVPDLTNHPGPFHQWISDVQVYKKPGSSGPTELWGLTFDNVSNVTALNNVLANIKKRPTTRIVFDTGQNPTSVYLSPLTTFHANSDIMGELIDSDYMTSYTAATADTWTQSYYSALHSVVDIWEIGNEVNGNWLSTLSNGADVMGKIEAMYDDISANPGTKTALTFFYEGEPSDPNNCIATDHGGNDMFTWITNNFSLNLPVGSRPAETEKIRTGLNYALISWYPDQCPGENPNWATVYTSLAAIFPNAKVGFGELGTANPQNGSAFEANEISTYYAMRPGVGGLPSSFIVGNFWWYAAEELAPWPGFATASFPTGMGPAINAQIN